jgi:hypothetical protein
MAVKPETEAPSAPPRQETFDNPEFSSPGADANARPSAVPGSLAAVRSDPKMMSSTQEMKPLDTVPPPQPAKGSGPLFAPTMAMAPVTVSSGGPRGAAPAARSVPPSVLIAVGLGAFALGCLVTWLATRPPRMETQAVEERPSLATPQVAAAATPHLPAAEVEVPRGAPEHAVAKTHHPGPAVKSTEEAPTTGAALHAYEAGNVEAALRIARAANASALVGQLTALEQARSAAAAAHAKQSFDPERTALENALKVDAAITRDPGPVRAQIREGLAQAHLQLGISAAAAKHQKVATDHLRTALAFHPGLAEAKKQLEALGQKP